MTTQETSLEAFASIQGNLEGMREIVYELIATDPTGGMTCDECELASGGRHQTVSARIYDLRRSGLIKDSSVRRNTRSGRSAIVWCAIEASEYTQPPSNGAQV